MSTLRLRLDQPASGGALLTVRLLTVREPAPLHHPKLGWEVPAGGVDAGDHAWFTLTPAQAAVSSERLESAGYVFEDVLVRRE